MALILLLSLLTLNDTVNVDIWVNKEDGVYHPGENLKIFFKVDKDCYVAVYDIEVGGRENILFPQPGEGGLVEADRIYELPPETAGFDYQINGPAGTETIIILAANDKLPQLNDNDPRITKKTIEIFIKELEPAKLRIIASPRRCDIYITELASDKEVYIGESPHTIILRPGEYLVKIEKFGYRTLCRRIRLEPGDRRRVFAKLWTY